MTAEVVMRLYLARRRVEAQMARARLEVIRRQLTAMRGQP